MKRFGNLMYSIADIDNLRLAYWKAQRGKSHQSEVIKYRASLDHHLLLLRHQLLSVELDVGNYRYFTIHDPKK